MRIGLGLAIVLSHCGERSILLFLQGERSLSRKIHIILLFTFNDRSGHRPSRLVLAIPRKCVRRAQPADDCHDGYGISNSMHCLLSSSLGPFRIYCEDAVRMITPFLSSQPSKTSSPPASEMR